MENNNQEIIKHALNVMDIKLKDDEIELVQSVNMREYAVANKEKPLLLTVGLQSCIALYGWCKDFSYLAHMNMRTVESDFYTDEQGNPIKCKKIEDLYNEILKCKDKITETINIGIILGVRPLEESSLGRRIIEKDLLNIFSKLKEQNINVYRTPNLNAFSLVLDSRNGDIILEDNKKISLTQLCKNTKTVENQDTERI